MASLYSAWTDGGTYDSANAFLAAASKNADAEVTYGTRATEILNDLAKYAGNTADAWSEQAGAAWKKFGDLAGEIGSQSMVDPDLAKAAQNAKKWSDLAADASSLVKNSANSVNLTKAKWANTGGALNALQMLGALAQGTNDAVGKAAIGIAIGIVIGILASPLGIPASLAIGLLVGFTSTPFIDEYFYFEGNFWDDLFSGINHLTDNLKGLFGLLPKDNTFRLVRYDPLAIDLDGDGLIATKADSGWNGAMFDSDGDGIRTASGWIGSTDGLLVRDINGNGTIESGAELFGERTVLSNGSRASDGFAALADMDTNHDGVIDARDTAFDSIMVWRDSNGDGKTDPGELLSLASLGIRSFSLKVDRASNGAVNGGSILGSATYTAVNSNGEAVEHKVQDFELIKDEMHSSFSTPVTVSDRARALPDFKGIGHLRSLREAATLSSSLANAVEAFAAGQSRVEQRALLDNLLLEWAKTNPGYDDHHILLHSWGDHQDPNSGNAIALLPGELPFDYIRSLDWDTIHKIRVVEALIGAPAMSDMFLGNGTLIKYLDIYNSFFEGVYGNLTVQTRLHAYTEAMTVTVADSLDGFKTDMTGAIALMKANFAASPIATVADLIDLVGSVAVFAGEKQQILPLMASWIDTIDSSGQSEALASYFGEEVIKIDGKLFFSLDKGAADGGFRVLIDNSRDSFISGYKGNGAIFGGAGNDVISGGAGDDMIFGGIGDDVLDGGEGTNVVNGGLGDDRLTASYWYAYNTTFEGGQGDDTIVATANADTFVFNLGDGKDTITEAGGSDTLIFGAGIVASDIQLLHVGSDLVLSHLNGTDSITVKGWFAREDNGAAYVDNFRFADGTTWDIDKLRAMPITATGSAADDTIQGWTGSDTMTGGTGNDTLIGGSGDDSLYGGDGDDMLYGDYGKNTLDGGAGNDTLSVADGTGSVLKGGAGDDKLAASAWYAYTTTFEGGAGNDQITGTYNNDTYFYGLGDGNDTISERGGTDVLQFGEGISDDQVWLRKVGPDLEVSVIGRAQATTVNGWFASNANQIESFATSNGHVMSASAVNALVSAMAGFAPPIDGQTILPDDYRAQLGASIASSWTS